MRFIGDTHGCFKNYVEMVGDSEKSIQVGDFGIGFTDDSEVPYLGPEHIFIRGNHDNPAKCRVHPNYVGDLVVDGKIFFMSGARSIDYMDRDSWRGMNAPKLADPEHQRLIERADNIGNMRLNGSDWWPDEELSVSALYAAIDIYEQVKPTVVVTHDCPDSVALKMFSRREKRPSKTATALSQMFEIHQPEIWVFGHWHQNAHQVINGTRFFCVDKNAAWDIDISWCT